MPVLLPLTLFLLAGQEIPKDVRYKRATPAINAAAEKNLHTIFDKKPTLADWSPVAALPTIIGPNLWRAMKGAVAKEYATSKKVTFMVPTDKEILELEGRVPRTGDQLELAWMAVSALAEKSGKATIRRAKADELSYYWAIIAYDIDEPLYVVDCGKTKFIMDFTVTTKGSRVTFIDILPPAKKKGKN